MSDIKRYAAQRELEEAALAVRRAVTQAQWAEVNGALIIQMKAIWSDLTLLSKQMQNPEPKPGVDAAEDPSG